MDTPNYQFEDFLMSVSDEYRSFVTTVNELLLQEGCKVKIVSSKTYLFSVKYTQGRKGTFNFMLRKKGLKASVFAGNFKQYPDVINNLPESMVKQIAKTSDCKNMLSTPACWDGCIGYDIPIKGENYQKCRFNCFQFDVDSESAPVLLEMLENELKQRRAS